jgi:fatty acid-binding protein 3
MDEYLKELGVGMMARMMAKGMKPRVVIIEKDGNWTLRTETTIRTMVIEFTPNVEYEETTPDGRQLKVI